jgi:hypothetical protein
VRVADLHGFRRAITELVRGPESPRSSRPVIVVPTRSAGRQLTRSIADAVCVTRDELYELFHSRAVDAPRRLDIIEREVVAQAAARAAASRAGDLPFQLRPGLVVEMLRFYDHLRRQLQPVSRFETLMLDELARAQDGVAAERLRRQTVFLADAFRQYERRVLDAGACDEHVLREYLLSASLRDPITHIIVTIADWVADSDGLYVADFDLLARLPALESVDIVATEAVLRSGFEERLGNWWPGLEHLDRSGGVSTADHKPVLVTRAGARDDELWWTHRDREEELIAVIRALRADANTGENMPLERAAVVFKRPLPYLYMAPALFREARMP